jgi:putative tryptophan/tyrosine transport system substrate-binding protein
MCVSIAVRSNADLDEAFARLQREMVEGAILLGDGVTYTLRGRIAALATRAKIPVIYQWREAIDSGGLISYGANMPALVRRSAFYVDRILKGAHPGDLPVEQPTRFDLIINMKAAKEIGLTIPPSLLARADQVVACPEKAGASNGC